MSNESLTYYEQLHKLVTEYRTAHWDAKKRYSKSAAEKEYRLGLEIDKLVRNENLNRRNAVNNERKTLE